MLIRTAMLTGVTCRNYDCYPKIIILIASKLCTENSKSCPNV